MRNGATPSNRDAVARKRRRDFIRWQHLIRQAAVAEMNLKRIANNGGSPEEILTAMEALNKAKYLAGLTSDAALNKAKDIAGVNFDAA